MHTHTHADARIQCARTHAHAQAYAHSAHAHTRSRSRTNAVRTHTHTRRRAGTDARACLRSRARSPSHPLTLTLRTSPRPTHPTHTRTVATSVGRDLGTMPRGDGTWRYARARVNSTQPLSLSPPVPQGRETSEPPAPWHRRPDGAGDFVGGRAAPPSAPGRVGGLPVARCPTRRRRHAHAQCGPAAHTHSLTFAHTHRRACSWVRACTPGRRPARQTVDSDRRTRARVGPGRSPQRCQLPGPRALWPDGASGASHSPTVSPRHPTRPGPRPGPTRPTDGLSLSLRLTQWGRARDHSQAESESEPLALSLGPGLPLELSPSGSDRHWHQWLG